MLYRYNGPCNECHTVVFRQLSNLFTRITRSNITTTQEARIEAHKLNLARGESSIDVLLVLMPLLLMPSRWLELPHNRMSLGLGKRRDRTERRGGEGEVGYWRIGEECYNVVRDSDRMKTGGGGGVLWPEGGADRAEIRWRRRQRCSSTWGCGVLRSEGRDRAEATTRGLGAETTIGGSGWRSSRDRAEMSRLYRVDTDGDRVVSHFCRADSDYPVTDYRLHSTKHM